MDLLGKEYTISFYNRSLSMHGDYPEAVNWTPEGQRLRFETMLKIDGEMSGKKVLDYGCGKGDFYQFLKRRNIAVSYSGFDINEMLVSVARKKFPECDFRVFDIDENELDDEFDYIFLSGVYNLKIEGLVETAQRSLSRLFKRCRVALAFNALSSHERKKDTVLQYFHPSEMFDFAVNNLSPYVSLFHDYVPCDFTLFVRRNSL